MSNKCPFLRLGSNLHATQTTDLYLGLYLEFKYWLYCSTSVNRKSELTMFRAFQQLRDPLLAPGVKFEIGIVLHCYIIEHFLVARG